MPYLTKNILYQPLVYVDDAQAGQFQAKGWHEATEAEVATYRKTTPWTDGLPYPTPLVLPDDSPAAANNAPEFPGDRSR